MDSRALSGDQSCGHKCGVERDFCEHDQHEAVIGESKEGGIIRRGLDGAKGGQDTGNCQNRSNGKRGPAELHVEATVARTDEERLDEEQHDPAGHGSAMNRVKDEHSRVD